VALVADLVSCASACGGGKAAGGTVAARRGGGRRQRRRLPCAARPPGPLANSLRARKRALRSDTARESVYEAREYARGQETLRCSPRRPHRAQAPGRSPGTNSPPDCLCPGSPPPMRAAAVLPAALRARCALRRKGLSTATAVSAQAGVGQGLGRTCGVEQRRASGRACTHAHPHLTRAQCLSKANAVSEASLGAGQKAEQRRAVGERSELTAAYKPQALAHPRLSRHNPRRATQARQRGCLSKRTQP
jgi:hypothetical protein